MKAADCRTLGEVYLYGLYAGLNGMSGDIWELPVLTIPGHVVTAAKEVVMEEHTPVMKQFMAGMRHGQAEAAKKRLTYSGSRIHLRDKLQKARDRTMRARGW